MSLHYIIPCVTDQLGLVFNQFKTVGFADYNERREEANPFDREARKWLGKLEAIQQQDDEQP